MSSLFFWYGLIVLSILHTSLFLSHGLIPKLLSLLPEQTFEYLTNIFETIGVDFEDMDIITEMIILADLLFIAFIVIKLCCFGLGQLNAGILMIIFVYLIISTLKEWRFETMEGIRKDVIPLELQHLHLDL